MYQVYSWFTLQRAIHVSCELSDIHNNRSIIEIVISVKYSTLRLDWDGPLALVLDGLFGGRHHQYAIRGQVGGDHGGVAPLGQSVLPAELPRHELVVRLLLVLGLHAQRVAHHAHLDLVGSVVVCVKADLELGVVVLQPDDLLVLIGVDVGEEVRGEEGGGGVVLPAQHPLRREHPFSRKEHGSWRRRRGALLRLGLLHLDGLGLVPELLALLHHVLPQAVEVVPRVLEERVLEKEIPQRQRNSGRRIRRLSHLAAKLTSFKSRSERLTRGAP